MPVTRAYQCPDCGAVFRHLHLNSEEPPPSFCPHCGNSMVDPKPQISAPHIARAAGKSGDAVYRAMEDASAHRQEQAAQSLGVDVAEMNAMKITDMRDNQRAGDIAASPTPGATAVNGMHGTLGDQSNVAQYLASVRGAPDRGGAWAAANALKARHGGRH